jgi:actin beta/gamma 1
MAANPQEEDYANPVVILDNGSGTCKAGLSTQDDPSVVFPQVIGIPRSPWQSFLEQELYVGSEVVPVQSKVKRCHPVEHGVIQDFEHMECLWEHAFESIGIDPSSHPVLLTDPPFNPKSNRAHMAEIMFESFAVPCLNVSVQGVLALYGEGRTTGVVLDIGEGVTHTIPIYNGFCMPHCVNRLDFAGKDLNTLLAKLVAQRGISLTSTDDQQHVRRMKETNCYCAPTPACERADSVTYALPDGCNVELADERWMVPEALFRPSIVGLESVGVGGLVWDSISKSDIDLRKTLQSSIVLSGGSTMFPGFSERLLHDLQSLAPSLARNNLRVVETKRPDHAVWRGGKVFAELRSIDVSQWVSIDDYYEYGSDCIHNTLALKYS